nr:MAG TPA: hypothetical protein [Caudoviricetes sp.]
MHKYIVPDMSILYIVPDITLWYNIYKREVDKWQFQKLNKKQSPNI